MVKLSTNLKFVLSYASVFLAATIGSLATYQAIPTWYQTLVKPTFTPPSYLFGPVWTVLYILMAFAMFKAWQSKSKDRMQWLKIFVIHLMVNALWSILFFGLRNIFLALVVITILWGMILYLILKALKFSKLSAYLMYPYLLWVSFASLLNYSLWVLN